MSICMIVFAQELAMSRKQEFAALLQEHAQIVNSVHRLEGADATSNSTVGSTGTTVETQGQVWVSGDKENF